MESLAGDGGAAAGELPIGLALPANLDLFSAMAGGKHASYGLGDGFNGGAPPGLGQSGDGFVAQAD